MTSTLPKIIFFGTDAFSLTALTGLIEAGYPVAAVVTKPDSPKGRGHKVTMPLVKTLASRYDIPTWQPHTLSDIKVDIKALGKPLGILSSYGKIIPQPIIDLFEPGIINIHPSLLPHYRGSTPIETAILNGDTKTGVSIMQLVSRMDAGPVYATKEHRLTGRETKLELYHALATIGSDLLLETLPTIINGSLLPTPQDESKATFTRLLQKDDAWFLPEKYTATEAERRVRAHQEFPKTKIQLKDHAVVITKAHVTDYQTNDTDIACKDDSFLAIDEVIAPSGRRMSAADFARGYLRT